MAKAVIMGGGGGGASSDELTAARGDVLKGKTAVTSDSSDEPVEGTLELTGDAADSHVLSGKTYYNKDPKTRRAGTMPNRGAVAQELAAGGSYTVPEGYHNGGGKVTAKSLASQTGGATAADGDVLSGRTYWKDGVKRTGTMANRGAAGTSLNAGGSYTIPAGYHNGSGRVTANSLASQTSANAAAGHILSGKTAWVNGSKITGTLAIQSAISFSAAALSATSIRISWKNPSKGPWQGVFIQMSTSGNPGASGGTRKYTGAGNNPSQAGGSNYVDITGLAANTTYYFTCTSYCNNLGNGVSYNVSAVTPKSFKQELNEILPFNYFAIGRLLTSDRVVMRSTINDMTEDSIIIPGSPYQTSGTIYDNTDISQDVNGVRHYGIDLVYGYSGSWPNITEEQKALLMQYKARIKYKSGNTVDLGKIVGVFNYFFSQGALKYKELILVFEKATKGFGANYGEVYGGTMTFYK